MRHRVSTRVAAGSAGFCLMFFVTSANAAEMLYNGIDFEMTKRELTKEPMPVPYLDTPPTVIPIDVGRQLFVDDFLIDDSTATRTYHNATYWPDNPVLKPDRPWESIDRDGVVTPTAMVFSDGVWYDPADKLFKMWYMGGYCQTTCYATSSDGIVWEKPLLDVVPDTNIVHPANRDSSVVWLDLFEKDPAQRYKLGMYRDGHMTLHVSADGIHWVDAGVSGDVGDRTTFHYNPFRSVWVFDLRDYEPGGIGRYRRYWEAPGFVEAAQWGDVKNAPFWIGASIHDPARVDLNTPCELYNLDVVAYESLMIGLFSIWRGQPSDRAKPNELCIGFSRDGFHWQRPTHEPFVPVSERYGDWNWANIQSAGGCCLVVDDQLRFYVSGRAGVPGSKNSGVCATGIATLRRDGFASLDAGEDAAIVTTRPLRFSGTCLFINADASEGEVRVEALNEAGDVVAPYAAAACTPFTGNSTRARITWDGAADLAPLAGTPVRLRFHLRNARLFSFWVSPDERGASHGYVAAGGPGFTGPTDTAGSGTASE